MDLRKNYRVKPNTKVKLKDYDPADVDGITDKAVANAVVAADQEKLTRLQYQLYAESKQSLLIVLQALDAGGKDGIINQVLAVMNPQGCRVQSFKVPTPLESSHDFLWRAHTVAPRNGEVVIYNRSYYESVLVERVHELAPKEEIEARYGFINDFERLLSFNRTKIIKFFLHISPEEQLKRFLERLEDPTKNWKISDSDYQERVHWDDYIKAFERVLSRCSTEESPWYVIPSEKKWFRNLAVSNIIVNTLADMDPQFPPPHVNLEEIRSLAVVEAAKAGLEFPRSGKKAD